MVDVGLTQAIVKRLNKSYRRRAKPRGMVDHYYRGIRLSYNFSYRLWACFFSLFLLSIGGGLYLVPNVFSDEPVVGFIVKTAWLGIIALAILAPIQAFRDFVIVNDEELMKSDLFGRKTRLEWSQISNLVIKSDENDVILNTATKARLKMSLCYDGWQDFLEVAARHLNPPLYRQLCSTMTNIDAQRPVLPSTKKSRRAKWFSFRRSS